MKFPRRQFLRWAASGAVVTAASRIAWSEAYPIRPVRVVLGLAPGGSVDTVSRIVARRLTEQLGQSFVVENRPGAASNIATELVVRARPDGYTLLVVLAANAINVSMYKTLNFNFADDIVPVAGLVRVPNVMEVHPSVPARTVPQFIAYARANPGKLSYGSSGRGTSPHVVGELFKMMTGIDMVHVAYSGGAPALIDLLSGRIQVMFDTVPQSIDYIRSGRLVGLAVTTATRSEALPEIPPMRDFVPGFEAGSWWGVGAPRMTPSEIIKQLNEEINSALTEPAIRAQLGELGTTPLLFTSAQFGAFVQAETEKWAQVLEFAGVAQN